LGIAKKRNPPAHPKDNLSLEGKSPGSPKTINISEETPGLLTLADISDFTYNPPIKLLRGILLKRKQLSPSEKVIKEARDVLRIEAEGVFNLIDKIGEDFVRAVDVILGVSGRVIATGIGKSGIVARKLAATLNSTGTPSLFLHPAEALHGDLGMVTSKDIVIAISNSGETRELNLIIPSLKEIGTRLIVFTGNYDSTLARNSTIVIDIGVAREACPLGLAPTASTTAALAMADALAVVLINKRGFKARDFHRYHPGGELGVSASLKVKVKEVMLTGNLVPTVGEGSRVNQVINVMNRKNIGVTLVVRDDGILAGVVTDGEIRKALRKHKEIHKLKVCDIMKSDCKTMGEDYSAFRALEFMEGHGITVLPIVDNSNRVKGILHLNHLLMMENIKSHL
jgi:arabinose-5-phosphate isomerase